MNSDYREVNQNEQEEQQMYLETPIYKEAVSHFRTTQYYFISFNSLKIGCGFALLYMNHEQTYLNYWILAIMFHAFIMIIVHKNHLKYLTMNKRVLAYKLDQIFAAPIVEQVIESRKLNILSRQIKLEIVKSTIFGKWCCRIITIMYQLIFGYGVYLFCIYYSMRSEELMNQYYFLCAILIISLYQYIDLYLILALAILGSPFLLIFACYYSSCIKYFFKRDLQICKFILKEDIINIIQMGISINLIIILKTGQLQKSGFGGIGFYKLCQILLRIQNNCVNQLQQYNIYQHSLFNISIQISFQHVPSLLIYYASIILCKFVMKLTQSNRFGKEQQRNEVRTRLQAIKYKPNQIEGEQECCICRCPYELNEEVVVLKCSKLHHYHETCIMSWININNTCPFCRKSI